MAFEVKLPQLMESMLEGTITGWLKSEGETVQAGEPLFDVLTDKALMEVEAPATGVLDRILLPRGDAEVGTVIGIILAPGEARTPAPGSPPSSDAPPKAERPVQPIASPPSVELTQSPDGEEIIPLAGARKDLAERLSLSRRTAADLMVVEVDMTEVAAPREHVNLTSTAFVARAVTRTLGEFPILNSRLHGDWEELSGSTFTITDFGDDGPLLFTPIINPPESAVLGMGKTVKTPVVRDDQIVIRQMMYLCLAYDHRVIDGRPAARFLQRVKELLEKPELLL